MAKATDIVWMNLGRATVFIRVLKRTLRRCLKKEELWSGNKESLRRAFLSHDSILLWSLTTYGTNRAKYTRLRQDPAFSIYGGTRSERITMRTAYYPKHAATPN